MKRGISVVLVLIICAFAVCGCDFFRTVAGRPVSADIEKKRLELAAAEKALADSVARADSLHQAEMAMEAARLLENSKFGIVLGSFKDAQNAEKLLQRAKDAGYNGRIFLYKGLQTVLVCPTDDKEEAEKSLELVSKEPFCPKGAWIYVAK